MFRRVAPTAYRLAAVRAPLVLRPPRRSSTYFCFNTVMPVIPACYWSVLPNGVRVISEQTCEPLAAVMLFVEGGPRFEAPCNNGVTHFIEHMAFRGLETLYRCPFEEYIQSIGAKMSVHTEREYQVFSATCPNECVPAIINILCRIILELRLDLVEMECAKTAVFREMADEERDPRALMYHYMHAVAFQGTPLGQPVIGPSKNYKLFDKEFVRAFIKQHYQPFRMVVAVSSKCSHHEVVCVAQRDFGPIEKTTNELVYWPCRFTGCDARYRNDDLPFAHVALAVEAGGYCSPDHTVLQLMRHIVGRWDVSQVQGYNTWPFLAHASALSNLCVHYESFYLPYTDVGLFGIYCVIPKEEDIENMIIQIQHRWKCLCTSTVHADVQRAAASLKLEMAKSVEGCINSCYDMGLQMLYFRNRVNLIEMFESVDRLKQDEVRDAGLKLLYDRCHVQTAVGPTESMPHYTRARAGMYWLRY